MTTARVPVWDRFVRLFHWSLVAAFAVTYITGDAWRSYHVAAGYAALFLIIARVLWGRNGSRHARFSQFVISPAAILDYLRDVTRGREARYLGHNPAGGAMILMMLILLMAVCGSGVLMTTDAFWGSENMDHIHGALADITLLCIVVHVAGVIFTSIRTKENLVWSMMTGRKRAPDEGDVG